MSTSFAMPPVGAVFRRLAGDSQIRWLADGYPGRPAADDGEAGSSVHPLFGTYALADYIDQYWRTPSVELSDAIRMVAKAAVGRMERHRDALVFYYDESDDASQSTQRHYSGLTQSYYAVSLTRAATVLRDQDLADAAGRAFAAITIPASDGGVYTEGQLGPYIAQTPQEPAGYILNAWQSALASILEFADVAERGDARELAHSSGQEMARMLPLYDCPALCNSRIGLTGSVYVRLVFRGPYLGGVEVSDAAVVVPGDVVRPIEELDGGRQHNHVLAKDVRQRVGGSLHIRENVLRMNVILSRSCFPIPNRLRCALVGDGGTVDVQVQQGRYDPLAASPADRGWVTVSRIQCPEGTVRIDIPLPWDLTDLVAYPTNFLKKVGGEHVNVYHLTHIRRLRELSAGAGIPELREWADTWDRYVGRWGSMAEYRGLHIRSGQGTTPVEQAIRPLPRWTADASRDVVVAPHR